MNQLKSELYFRFGKKLINKYIFTFKTHITIVFCITQQFHGTCCYPTFLWIPWRGNISISLNTFRKIYKYHKRTISNGSEMQIDILMNIYINEYDFTVFNKYLKYHIFRIIFFNSIHDIS